MEITKGQTFTLRGTGQITVARVFTHRDGQVRVSVTGDARFTMGAEMFAEMIEKIGVAA